MLGATPAPRLVSMNRKTLAAALAALLLAGLAYFAGRQQAPALAAMPPAEETTAGEGDGGADPSATPSPPAPRPARPLPGVQPTYV